MLITTSNRGDPPPDFVIYSFEDAGFYHSISVDCAFPFASPGIRKLCETRWAADVGDTLENWAAAWNYGNLSPVAIIPGQFHPRIWRGDMPNLPVITLADSPANYSSAVVAGRLLGDKLFEIFTYLEPASQNLPATGHKIRELLVLACMEVESNWSGVLLANSYSQTGRLSTNDYVKLLGPMGLAGYEVRFPLFPEFQPIAPFATWCADQPTQSLSWYDSYNATKHSREQNFDRATLRNAIDAVAAVVVMLCAQFGPTAVPAELQATKGFDANFPYVPTQFGRRGANPDGTTSSFYWGKEYSSWSKSAYPF